MSSLYAGGLQLTRNARDAEDLVQDTYVRAFEKFEQYREGTNLKAWMHRIMFNRFVNLYRKRRARPEAANFEEVQEYVGEEDRLVLHDFQAAESLQELMENESFLESLDDNLKNALEGLGEEYRLVFLMNVIGEMAYKEIAAALSIPVGTVMSRLSRAKSMLRDRLAELGGGIVQGQ